MDLENTQSTNTCKLLKEEKESLLEQLKRILELNGAYQSALSMDILTFNNRIKEYRNLMEIIRKSLKKLGKKRRMHLNSLFLEDCTSRFSSTNFLVHKKCPKYFQELKRMRIAAKQQEREGNRKIAMQPDFCANKFSFTKEEDAKLLGMRGSDWIAIAAKLGRPALECVRRNLELNGKIHKAKWTDSENKVMRDVVKIYGTKNWVQISNFFEGKSSTQCFHQWMKRLNPEISKGKWLPVEDARLVIAYQIMNNPSTKHWNKIASHIPGKTDIKCRERYCNILDPELRHELWSPEEDQELFRLVEINGPKWADIAKQLGRRTDNQCWRRWKRLQKRSRASSPSSFCPKKPRKRVYKPIFKITKGNQRVYHPILAKK